MVLKHSSIDLFGLPLFTWVTVESPSETTIPLPSEACFAYIVDGDDSTLLKRENIKAVAGQVILSLCGQTLSKRLSEPQRGRFSSIIVHFHREQLLKVYDKSPPPAWKELEAPVVQYIVQTAASEMVKQFIEGIAHLFLNRGAISDDFLILKLQEIILLLLKTDNSPQVVAIMRSLFSTRTFTFKEIIDAHIFSNYPLETLAGLTNNSLSSFKREFKKIYNSTPSHYIINKRTEKVAELLKISDETISNIGYDCGFNSPAHLSRVFKNKYGVTPSQYRVDFSVK